MKLCQNILPISLVSMGMTFILLGSTGLTTTQATEVGIIDLLNLENYANQETPDYITRDNTPDGNPITDLGATLGRVLFYDKRLSRNDTISCASCHQQSHAFSDVADASAGVNGTTGRHSMRLINNRYSQDRRRFWDERANSVEAQSTQPIQDHIEMGFSGADGDPDFSDLVTKLSAIEEYRVLFVGVFGDPNITEIRIQRSLAQFIRSIQSFDSKYDEGRSQVNNDNANFPNFTNDENAGKALFLAPPAPPRPGRQISGAGCAACHRPPEFDIDPNSGNNGVIGSINGDSDFTNTRSPSLRDLVGPSGESHGAFMHDASLATLEDVVDHYNSINGVNTGLDNRLRGGPGGQGQQLNLSSDQKSQLVAFLKTLTGNAIYDDPKFSDPFDEAGQINLILLPVDGSEISFTGSGNNRQAVLTSSGVPNVDYVVQSSTNLVDWINIPTTASAEGVLSVMVEAPASTPGMFFRVSYSSLGGD